MIVESREGVSWACVGHQHLILWTVERKETPAMVEGKQVRIVVRRGDHDCQPLCHQEKQADRDILQERVERKEDVGAKWQKTDA